MPLIDLNSTVGESFGVWKIGMDDAMLRTVSSASLACGVHAGDPLIMQTTAGLLRRASIGIGALIGYPDIQGFGRRDMNMTPYEIYAYSLYQIGALQAICKANNVRLDHVKAHGALYNRGVAELPAAKSIASAVRDADNDLILLGHANSSFEVAAQSVGIKFAAEFFADRGYREDGSLVPRGERGDVIADPEAASARVLKLLNEGVLETVTGTTLPMKIQSIGLHGEFPGAPQLAYTVRQALEGAGYTVTRLRKILEPPQEEASHPVA